MSNKKSTSDDKSITFTAFDDIVKKSEDFIFIKDAHSIYLGCSDTFAKLTGRDSSADVIGKTDFDLFPRDIAEKYVKDDIEVFKIKKPLFNLVEKIPGPNGTTGWTKTSKTPVFDKEGKLVGIYGVSRDITRVVSLEGELQTAQKYSDLVSHFPGGVSIFHEKDGAFFLDFANDSFFQLHGVDSKNGKQWIGQNISSVLEAEDLKRIINEFGKIASDKKGTATSTYRFKGEDGQIHWIMIASHYAYTQQGIDYYYASYANIDNQKEVEKKLVDSQDTLRDAINNSNIQYFTYYPNKHLVEINTLNNSYCNLPLQWNNYPDDFLAFVKASPSDADIYRQMVKKIDEGEKEAGCTIQMFYRGVFLWQKVKITAIKDNFGNTVKALGYSLDVTDRKKAEQLIQKERMRFRAKEGNIFETFSFNLTKNSEPVIQTMDKEMIDAVITDDIYNEAVAISPNLANSTPAVRSIMLKVATLIPEHKDRELFINTFSGSAVRQAFSDGKYTVTAEYRRRRGDSIHWVSTTMEALPDPDTGDIIAFFATKDINEQVLKEKIIKCIYDFQYETVFLLDLNSKKVRLFSYRDKNEQSLDGLDYSECLKKVSERAEESNREQFLKQYDLADIQEHLKAGGVYTLYYERNQKAENLPGNVNKRIKSDIFFLDENKDVLVFLTTDVTSIFEQERENRERLSQALAAAEQASLAKTQFLSRMSHEIRTPMNAIIGLDSIALQEKDLSSAMEDHLQKIGISARFLLSLINDILDMSRIESGRMMLNIAPFNFEELINGINTILYQQCHECELDYECILKSYTEDTYVGDVTKLQQVLVNILGNAVKFTPKGGKVTFSIEQVSQTKEKAKMRFEIADTGIGIDEKFIPQLFQPFSQENRGKTSAYGGTGLGLAISKNIVNLMNGEITVHSIKNVGSEFTVEIELGLSEKSIQRNKMISPRMLPLYTLIVDDDIIVCQHTKMILDQAGLNTEWIDSGPGAIKKVTDQHNRKKDYDLILLDWKMPDMDGIETAREIRKIVGPEVTIIIMTAYDWADIEKKAMAAGVDMFMKKPIFASSVTKAFENVFMRKNNISQEETNKKEYDFAGKRILLAEDNEINAEISKSLIESKHCQVELAVNGAEAVESFASAPVNYYDAILMDVRMPVMDGLEASKTIRAMRKEGSKTIPIIAMTANAFDEDVQDSLKSGMNAHLAKPIEPEKLFDTLQKFFSHKE